MLYANSPAVQARVDAYVRKPSLAPLHRPGHPDAKMAAQIERHTRPSSASLNRVTLVSAAIHELSTPNPED